MITIAITVALIILGIFLMIRYDFEVWSVAGVIVAFASAMYLIGHLVVWNLVEYDYGMYKTQRESFEQTLQASRESDNPYESAAIVKEVAAWNTQLARLKYKNNTLFWDQYIDDRIEDLEPIK